MYNQRTLFVDLHIQNNKLKTEVMEATKQELAKMKFSYELFYESFFCQRFDTLESAIKRAKQSVKDNPECKGGYSIVLHSMIIAVY